jgi:hypothetical protein
LRASPRSDSPGSLTPIRCNGAKEHAVMGCTRGKRTPSPFLRPAPPSSTLRERSPPPSDDHCCTSRATCKAHPTMIPACRCVVSRL